jgi:hypothetical protein
VDFSERVRSADAREALTASSRDGLRISIPTELTRLVKRREPQSQVSAEANKMLSGYVLFNLYCRNM